MVTKKINLASTRMAFFLIALVALQILVSAVVPQRDLAVGQIIGWRSTFQDSPFLAKLWLDRIYYSPVFFVSLSLLGINLLAGNVRRFRTVWRIEKTLLKVRHVGSIVFHLALLVVIAGVLLNNLFRFTGVFGMTEGQVVRDVASDYMRQTTGLLRQERPGKFHLRLDKVDRFREVGNAVTEEVLVHLMPTDGSPPVAAGVRTNRPLQWNGLEFHLGGVTGYSPELVILADDGRLLLQGFVRLKATRKEASFEHEDFVRLEDEDLVVRIGVRPDPQNPQVAGRRLTVTRRDTTLFDGELAASDTLTAGGLRITVPRMRSWCYLNVRGNPLLWLVFTGFWLGLTGMAISVLARVIHGGKRQV
jgi:cytochrome c biogenesis protein ResB